MNPIASFQVVGLPASARRYVQARSDEPSSGALPPDSYQLSSIKVNDMNNVSAKLLPLAAAAMLATLGAPVSADYNMNTTIQDGRINTNDTFQRGRGNDNATWQEGRDNANRTSQRGRENWNATAQFGRRNYNETHQSRRFQRTTATKRGRGQD
jgi:minor curlin subunit